MKKTLGEMFDQYGSDKNESHHYTPYYEKHLPDKVNNFLEIGVWKGGGIRAFKEYYEDKGEFYGMSYRFNDVDHPPMEQFVKWGIIPLEGNQDDVEYLKSIHDKFTVITEDGSHHSDSQIVTFKQMFPNNVEDGGLYVIEDVYGHLPDPEGSYWRREVVNTAEDTIMPLMRRWLNGEGIVSQYFNEEESDLICYSIKSIDIYDDKIIFITKK